MTSTAMGKTLTHKDQDLDFAALQALLDGITQHYVVEPCYYNPRHQQWFTLTV